MGEVGYAISPEGTEKVEPPGCQWTKSTLAMDGSKAWMLAVEQSAAALVTVDASSAALANGEIFML